MTLTDAVALVALLDVRDSYHFDALNALDRLSNEVMLTTMACLTEAMYLLFNQGGYAYQAELWNLRANGQLALHICTQNELDRMAVLMEQYNDTPMSLADASLIATAESLELRSVFTFDSDFYIYRLIDGSALEIIR